MARSTTATKLSTDDMEDERVMALLVTEATNLNLDDVSLKYRFIWNDTYYTLHNIPPRLESARSIY